MGFTQKNPVYWRVLACTGVYSLASEPREKYLGIGKQGLGSRGNFFQTREMNTSNDDSDDQTDDGIGYEILLTTEDDCKPLTGYDISVQQ